MEQDAINKRGFMRLERLATSIGAHVGALGILISGGAMASISSGPQWGWFDVVLYPWLALKQLLFIAIVVLVGFSIKRSMTFKEMLAEEEVASTETSKQWRRAYRMSIGIYILVVINTFLGLAKPGIGL